MLIIASPHRVGSLVLAALFGLSATSAFAAADSELYVAGHPAADARSITVAVRDLDLASARGRNTLTIRVNNAAQAVCDIHEGSKLDKLPAARECFDKAREQALAQLDARGFRASAAIASGGLD